MCSKLYQANTLSNGLSTALHTVGNCLDRSFQVTTTQPVYRARYGHPEKGFDLTAKQHTWYVSVALQLEALFENILIAIVLQLDIQPLSVGVCNRPSSEEGLKMVILSAWQSASPSDTKIWQRHLRPSQTYVNFLPGSLSVRPSMNERTASFCGARLCSTEP